MRSHKKIQVSKLIYMATVKKAIFWNLSFFIAGKLDKIWNFWKVEFPLKCLCNLSVTISIFGLFIIFLNIMLVYMKVHWKYYLLMIDSIQIWRGVKYPFLSCIKVQLIRLMIISHLIKGLVLCYLVHLDIMTRKMGFKACVNELDINSDSLVNDFLAKPILSFWQ